jgi:SAM-dependent methyltransferase
VPACAAGQRAADLQARPSRELTRAYKASLQTLFDARSATYGLDRTFHPPLVRRIAELAPLERGQCVLDVATGTGEAALAAAAAICGTGAVTGLDISPGMVEQARRLQLYVPCRKARASLRASAQSCCTVSTYAAMRERARARRVV